MGRGAIRWTSDAPAVQSLNPTPRISNAKRRREQKKRAKLRHQFLPLGEVTVSRGLDETTLGSRTNTDLHQGREPRLEESLLFRRIAETNGRLRGNSKQEAAETTPAPIQAAADTPRDVAQPDRTAAKLKLLDDVPELQSKRPTIAKPAMPTWTPSDQIHVLGLDLPGRYITHALAGCEMIPPVRCLLPQPHIYKSWLQAGRCLTLDVPKEGRRIVHNRVIGEFAPPLDYEIRPDNRWPIHDTIIHNLILTVPAGHVLRALEPIAHRLDQRSSICLIQEGLGVVEAVIDKFFPNEISRPTFILGHMATTLGYPAEEDRFRVTEIHRRKLYLTLYTPELRGPRGVVIKKHPPPVRIPRKTHLMQLLFAMPGLHAHTCPMEDWLREKLLVVIFRALADPLTALFDCQYEQIVGNPFARQLMDKCLNELCDVVVRLPEIQNSKKLNRFELGSALRDKFIKSMSYRRPPDTEMRYNIMRGWDSDVDYLTGYFVKRGRELRVSVNGLETLMLSVKAKQLINQKRSDSVIPFEEAYERAPRTPAKKDGNGKAPKGP